MKVISMAIELSTWDELDDKRKDVALNQLVNAWLEDKRMVPDDAIRSYNNAIEEAFQMQTPWFAGELVWKYCEKYLLRELKCSYFRKSGKFYDYIEFVDEEYEDVRG